MKPFVDNHFIRILVWSVCAFLAQTVYGGDSVPRAQTADTPFVKVPHRPQSIACNACHSEDSWKNLKPSIEFDHNKTGFALRGAHGKAPCAACHANGQFGSAIRECSACHQDPHQSQLGLDCRQCHTEQAWIPSTFRHSGQVMIMTGAHRGLDCGECHNNLRTFALPNIHDCSDCHKVTGPSHQRYRGFGDCRACHDQENWNDFPHYDGWLPLLGHHRVSCEDCHPQSPTNYKTTNCSLCHGSRIPGQGGGR